MLNLTGIINEDNLNEDLRIDELNELNERLMSNYHDPVYLITDIDEYFEGKSATEILQDTKELDLNDHYFIINGYGKLVSYSNLDELLDLYSDIELE